MRAIAVETVENFEYSNGKKPLRVQYRQDRGSRWSIWVESWLDGNYVQAQTTKHVDEVLKEINRFRKMPEEYTVRFSLI